MSDDKDFGFSDAEHNSGEHVSEAAKSQPPISGWQGGVPGDAGTDADVPDDEPAIE